MKKNLILILFLNHNDKNHRNIHTKNWLTLVFNAVIVLFNIKDSLEKSVVVLYYIF